MAQQAMSPLSGELYWENGKENGNYYLGLGFRILGNIGLFRDNAKENGNYHLGFRV